MMRPIVLLTAAILATQISTRGQSQTEAQQPTNSDLDADVVRVRDLGPLKFPRTVSGRDGGYSARFGGRSVWVFGDTILNTRALDGSRWRSSTWTWTLDFDASDGLGFREPLDARGAPGEFLPFTAKESTHNALHNRENLPEDQRSRWALWPGPLVVEPRTGKAYLFYSKVFSRVGPWAFKIVGRSIAVWDEPDKPPVRPQLRPGTGDPTILFSEHDPPVGERALILGDWLYAYACPQKGRGFECILGRAKFADALTRDAWEFFAGEASWRKDWHFAVTVLQGAPMMSVHWNEHLRRYLAVYSTPLLNTIEIRTASRPEGPWSAGRIVLTGKAPLTPGTWVYCGMAHAELARENGRIEYLSYCRETGFLQSEIRLVELTLK